MFFLLKILIAFQIILSSQVYAVTAEEESSQTADFVWALLWFFSIDLLLKIIFTIIVVVLTIIISKLIKNKLFWYLDIYSYYMIFYCPWSTLSWSWYIYVRYLIWYWFYLADISHELHFRDYYRISGELSYWRSNPGWG